MAAAIPPCVSESGASPTTTYVTTMISPGESDIRIDPHRINLVDRPLNVYTTGTSTASSNSEPCVICSTCPGSSLTPTKPPDTKTSELDETPCGHNGAENIGMGNPAAVYCNEMGYEYKVVKTEDGEKGIVTLPDGSECDAWAFYGGECGTEFSYCAKMGWPVAAEGKSDPIATKCTTCVLPDGSHQTVRELLNLSEKCRPGVESLSDAVPDEGYISDTSESGSIPPDHFDWRDEDGENWMTPVRDQAGCSSCWAFSAVGVVEPLYNIFYDEPNLDLDLSEQYLVSDCCTACGDCVGGSNARALRFIRDEGITDEACFPYSALNGPCSDRCADWSSRLKGIHETEYVQGDTQTIKEHLIERGPLAASMGIGEEAGGYFESGIYRCTDDSLTNHSVVIAGYDETEGYWIVKNSWGTGYGDNGYLKVGFGECSIESSVYYAALYAWPALLSPPSGLASRPGEVTLDWREQDGATGYHIQIDQVDTFDSPHLVEVEREETGYTANLSTGSYYWRVKAHLNGEDSPYSPAWRLTITNEPVVQVTDDYGNDYHPAIARTDDGKLWVVWYSERSGNSDIWYKTSSDGGATWSQASQITTYTGADYDPAIAQTADGRVWVVWESERSGNHDIWYKTSSDGGSNWSQASQITSDPNRDYGPAVTQTADGRVWVVWESERSGNYDIWYKTSSDGGSNWSEASQITTDLNHEHEPAVTQTADGRVWVVWTGELQGTLDIWYKTSSDGGATWSEASQITSDALSNSAPAITQTADGRVWVVWQSERSGNGDIWYKASSDGGATWFSVCQFTNFTGYDGHPAAVALAGSEPAVAFWSDRAVKYDIWYGTIGSMEDIDPPPHLDWALHEPDNPDTEQTVTIRAGVSDESGVQGVQLVWSIDGTPQENLPLYDDGYHDDGDADDGIYGVELGPFPTVDTVVEYQVQVTDIDENTIVGPEYPDSFQIIEPFITTGDILLVADNLGSYTPYYTDSLDGLAYEYDVWDTELRENIDGETLSQYLDGVVIWATPNWGYIGYAETQDNLASYLDSGGRLFISGQDIGHYIGSSTFYQDYLHAQYVQDDIDLFGLFGLPGDPITDGLYVSISGGDGANNQYSPSEINPLSPAVTTFTYDASATTPKFKPQLLEEGRERPGSDEMPPQQEPVATVSHGIGSTPTSSRIDIGTKAISSSGSGAIRANTGTYKVVYLAFGFEAINSATDREVVMDRVMTWLSLPITWVAIDCASVPEGGTADVDIIINTQDPDGIGSATITLTGDPSVVSVGDVTAGDLGAVTWDTVGSTTTIVSWTGGSPGPTGTVTFCTVTLHAEIPGSSALDIEVTSLYDGTAGNPQPITPSPVTDCIFSIDGRLEGDVYPLGAADGVIDSADFQLIAQHIVGTITLVEPDFLAADVNDSGTVDSADLQLMAQYLIGTIDGFPGGDYIP